MATSAGILGHVLYELPPHLKNNERVDADPSLRIIGALEEGASSELLADLVVDAKKYSWTSMVEPPFVMGACTYAADEDNRGPVENLPPEFQALALSDADWKDTRAVLNDNFDYSCEAFCPLSRLAILKKGCALEYNFSTSYLR